MERRKKFIVIFIISYAAAALTFLFLPIHDFTLLKGSREITSKMSGFQYIRASIQAGETVWFLKYSLIHVVVPALLFLLVLVILKKSSSQKY